MESTTTFELQSLHSDTHIVRRHDPEKKSKTRLYRLEGWRSGALGFALCATLVLIINLILTIWSAATRRATKGLLYQGDCDYAKRLNTGLHVLINILSTMLLSGSNYCMQCISAPTRLEVDKAHAANRWLDIGIPSLRNLRHVSRRNLVLWLLLALTSLPLHLFYNSAIYVSISSNSYFAFPVSESFVEGTECLHCATSPNKNTNFTGDSAWYYPNQDFPYILDSLWSRARNGTLDRLKPADCIDQYATLIQPYRRNLLLVASDNQFPGPDKNNFINGSHVYDALTFASINARGPQQAADAYQWICSGLNASDEHCTSGVSAVRSSPSTWRVGSDNCTVEVDHRNNLTSLDLRCNSRLHNTYPVSYCLSEKAPAHCKVHFSRDISILVTIINLVKAILMFYAAFYTSGEPLITVGDAIVSFLDRSDITTKNLCLLSVTDIKEGYIRPGGREWIHPKASWRHATSKTRRAVAILMLAIALTAVSVLLWLGIYKLPEGQSTTLSGLAQLGFGAVDPRTMITGNFQIVNLVSASIIANIPQLVLSILYFSYNSIFTAMLLSYEWMSYAQKRKGLRVSRPPIGEQRCSYFLQLPYRFSIPLMLLSGTLHWLVSQSIFLVSMDLYDYMDNRSAAGQEWLRVIADYSENIPLRITTCGYSPIAIISVLILGSLMLIALAGVGYIPYNHAMPLAGSCSMAISAACHPEKEDDYQISTQKLQWGAMQAVNDDESIGHCSFSASRVEPPVVGRTYA